jgi:hypothetical protein
MIRKYISAILAAIMICFIIPAFPAVESAAATTGLVLNANGTLSNEGVNLTASGSIGGGTFSVSGNTLTFTGVTYTTDAPHALNVTAWAGPSLEIVFNGANSLTTTSSSTETAGIYATTIPVTITVSGSLTVDGGDGSTSAYGLFLSASNTLTINGGTVNVSSNVYGIGAMCSGLILNNTALTAEGVQYGIYSSGGITMTGGTLTATGLGNASGYSEGIYIGGGGITATDGASITATGNDSSSTSAGIWAPSYTISLTDSTLNATGNDSTGNYSYGVYCSTIEADNSKITAVSSTASNYWSYAIYGSINAENCKGTTKITASAGDAASSAGVYGTVTLDDSELEATGGVVTHTSGSSYGIYGSLDATDSTVTAIGKSAATNSYGISYNVTSDNSTITVTSGVTTNNGSSRAIAGDITAIKGSNISATADEGGRSYGVGGDFGVDVDLNDSTLTATAGNATGGGQRSIGVYGSVNMENGSVLTATAKTATEGGSNSYGIDAAYTGDTITVEDSTITAIANTAAVNSFGINAVSLTVRSGGEVEAHAGVGTTKSVGVYVGTALAVQSGGTLEAYANGAGISNGNGIELSYSTSSSLIGDIIAIGSQYGYYGNVVANVLDPSDIENHAVFAGGTAASQRGVDVTSVYTTHEVWKSDDQVDGSNKAQVTEGNIDAALYLEFQNNNPPAVVIPSEPEQPTDTDDDALDPVVPSTPEVVETAPETPSYTNIAPPIRTNALPERPNIGPKNPYTTGGMVVEGNLSFTKNGVTAEIVRTAGRRYITVIAGVNENGTVRGDVTAAALWQAARLVRTLGYDYIDLYIPKKAIGISAKNTAKFYIAVGGVETIIRYHEDGSRTTLVPLTEDMGKLLT